MPSQAEDVALVTRNDSSTLMGLIERVATDPTVDAAKLGALLDVKLRWEADEARKAFHAAFNDFKKEVPKIVRTKPGHNGKYAPLDRVCTALIPALSQHGITHRWVTKDAPESIIVACFLKGYGHEEEGATLSGPPDTSGNKNPVQARMSTVTYLERYTLLASCGVAVEGTDDDGAGGQTGRALDEVEFAAHMERIQGAESADALKIAFLDAINAAKAAGDRQALQTFEKAKKEAWRANGGYR
jgi:ERF superfamily